MNLFNLIDKDIWVVGGAGYLGQSVVRYLLESGANVLCLDIGEKSQDLKKKIKSSRLMCDTLDINDVANLQTYVDGTIQLRGNPYGLVNLTFSSTSKNIDDLTEKEFIDANQTNLVSTFFLAKKIGDAMTERKEGSIVLLSSIYGHVSPNPELYFPPMHPNPIEYGVGKAGIVQITKYLAVHWAKKGIRCNCISPGPFTGTNLQEKAPEFIHRLEEKIPMGRVGKPEEVAGVVLFLLSKASGFMTGQNLFVDGGWTIW